MLVVSDSSISIISANEIDNSELFKMETGVKKCPLHIFNKEYLTIEIKAE